MSLNDHCWAASALAVELTSSPNFKERFLIVSVSTYSTEGRKALSMEANLELCRPLESSHLRLP